MTAYVYGFNKYLGHIREMNGKKRTKSKMLKPLKYCDPILKSLSTLTSNNKDKSKHYYEQYFHHNMIIVTIQKN